MKSINSWQDLQPYGIHMLTGEACGLTCRLLCDVTEKGRQLLSKVFGIPDMQLADNWNHGSKEDPHVGSIMLTRNIVPILAVFALLENGCDEVWTTKRDGTHGMEPDDSEEWREQWKEFHEEHILRRYAYRGTVGDRNQHVMSGRVE